MAILDLRVKKIRNDLDMDGNKILGLESGFSRTLLGDYTNTSGTCAENPTFDLPIDWQDYKYFEIVYKGVISSNNDCSVPTTFQGVTTRMDRTVMDSGIYIRMVGNVSGPDGTAVEFLNNHQIRITAPSASFSKGEDGTIMKLFGVKY